MYSISYVLRNVSSSMKDFTYELFYLSMSIYKSVFFCSFNLAVSFCTIHQYINFFYSQGGWSPLMWASYKGHEDIVALLLEKGADVHAHGNFNIKYET